MATRDLNLGGGRKSASPEIALQSRPQQSASNSTTENILQMAMFRPGGSYTDYSGQAAPLRTNSRTYGALGTTSIGGTDYTNLLGDVSAAGGGRADPRVSKAEADRLIAQNLGTFGITDMDDIGYVIGPGRQPIFYNRKTGQSIPQEIVGFKDREHGGQKLFLTIDQTGKVVPVNSYMQPNPSGKWKSAVAPILTVAGAAFAPYALGGLSSALAGAGVTGAAGTIGAGALYGAGLGGLGAGLTGGDIGKAMLTGAIGGGISSGIGTGLKLSPTQTLPQYNLAGSLLPSGASLANQQMVNAVLRGSIGGLATTAVGGGDAIKGALIGGLTSGISGQLPGGGNRLTQGLNQSVSRQIAQSIVGDPYARNTRAVQNIQQSMTGQQPRQTSALDVGSSNLRTSAVQDLGAGTGTRTQAATRTI